MCVQQLRSPRGNNQSHISPDSGRCCLCLFHAIITISHSLARSTLTTSGCAESTRGPQRTSLSARIFVAAHVLALPQHRVAILTNNDQTVREATSAALTSDKAPALAYLAPDVLYAGITTVYVASISSFLPLTSTGDSIREKGGFAGSNRNRMPDTCWEAPFVRGDAGHASLERRIAQLPHHIL